ncbi:MAG: glycosyltransferase family 39 protein [Taibaiella sp.]|nr:glycosyltransferase family 39 protein [Taibaiella sp.]
MSKRNRALLIAAFAVYVIYHLCTLVYSPLPWFDEISFLSMTESYMKDGTLFEQVRILGEPAEKLNYGPIYFVWQAFMIKTFGLGIFTVRITNMVFGFVVLLLVSVLCRALKLGTKATLITVAIVALEPNFNQFLHSGRMDNIGLSFFLLSCITFLAGRKRVGPVSVGYLVLTGLLICCSALTNPRFVFAFPVYIAFFVYDILASEKSERLKAFMRYVYIGGAFAFLYLVWVYTTFGGVSEYITYTRNATYLTDHMGLEKNFVLRYNLFVLLFALACAAFVVAQKKGREYADILLMSVPAIVSFSFIVTGGLEGRYFALVTPFVAIIIVGASRIKGSKWIAAGNYLLLAGFGALFVFKAAYIIATIPQHDPYANERVITKYIEPNTSVFGDFEYYYIARNKNCTYLTTEMNGMPQQVRDYVLAHKTRYVILKKDNIWRESWGIHFLNEHYELIATIEDSYRTGPFSAVLQKLPYKISDGYACYIYRYKDQ